MKEWLDGDKLADWMEEAAPETVAIARSRNGKAGDIGVFGRVLCRWRGTSVSIYTADYWLTSFGLHIHQIPPEVFTADSGRGHPPPRPDRKLPKVPA